MNFSLAKTLRALIEFGAIPIINTIQQGELSMQKFKIIITHMHQEVI